MGGGGTGRDDGGTGRDDDEEAASSVGEGEANLYTAYSIQYTLCYRGLYLLLICLATRVTGEPEKSLS